MCSTPHRTSDISLKTARPSKPFRMVKSEQSRWRSFFPIIQNQVFPKFPVVPFRPSTKSAWNAYASGGIPPRKLILWPTYILPPFWHRKSTSQSIEHQKISTMGVVSFIHISVTGWWYTYPSEKYEFVSWDYDIPNWMETCSIPWFQSPPTRSLIITMNHHENHYESPFITTNIHQPPTKLPSIITRRCPKKPQRLIRGFRPPGRLPGLTLV